jgi:DNA-binding beta-propeller fold protein YncE
MPHRNATAAARRALPLLALLVLSPLAEGCAAAPVKPSPAWPPPPEVTRIKHLRGFRIEDELVPSAWSRFARALVPTNERNALRSPNAIAIYPGDQILLVTNPGDGTLVRVDLVKGAMKVIGSGGQADLRRPFGVAVDAEQNAYVSDQASNEVVVLDPAYQVLRRFGRELLQGPTSVAVDRRGQLLYVVSGATSLRSEHRIEVFSLAGQHLRTLGKRGGNPGEFNFPQHLAVAPDGRLFVADMLNFRVQVFDSGGGFLATFGALGAGSVGAFDKIKGIAFDTFGNVYVTDSLHGVQIFNPRFQPLLAFAEGFMQSPAGIAVDGRNHIFVADQVGGFVHEYELVNTGAEDSYTDDGKAAGATAPPEARPASPTPPRP